MRAAPKLKPAQCHFYGNEWGFELVEDFAFSVHGGGVMSIPAGFWFNGGSVPAAFWQITYSPYDPRMLLGALPHDWLYCSHLTDRWTADMTLVDNLVAFGAFKAGAIKAAVRTFGGMFWRDTDRDKAYMSHLKSLIIRYGRGLAQYGLA